MYSIGFLSSTSSSSFATWKKKMNRPCHFCGESANPDICVTCCICKVSHVHLYCLHKKLATVSEKWYCEECKTLSSFQQELLDHLAINATWKGSFEILDSVLMGGTYEGLQAHLSWKVRRKVYEVANAMPSVLQLKLYPRSDVWPEAFNRLSPTVDDIALFFLPSDDKRFRKAYHLLSNVLKTTDSAMQSSLNDCELLIFSSKQLPTNSQRINQHFFLWGVFQSGGKRYSSSQPSLRTQQKSVSSALCNNDYGTNNDSPNIIKLDDFMAVKIETQIMVENNDQRRDETAFSNSYHEEEKKRKVGGDQGPLFTTKTEKPGSPPEFTRPNANVGYATSPALLMETLPGLTPKVEQPGEFDYTPEFMTPIATSPALLSGDPPGFKRPNTKDGYATSSALLMEAPPGFCTPIKPKQRGDSFNETNQKIKASDTMDAIALWASKRQRSARGTATSKDHHGSSFQLQKSTKVAETPQKAELLWRYHRSHGSTGMGIMYGNFVIVAGDGKSFRNGLLNELKYQKVKPHVGGGIQMWSARAGEKGKCVEAAKLIPEFLEQAGHQNDKIGFFRERMKAAPGRIDDWIFVFGGSQTQDGAQVPFLFSVKPGDSKHGRSYYTCGSGSWYASRVLEKIRFTDELTVDEAVMWVERALVYATIMDHYTGGRSFIKVIVDGVDQSDRKPWIYDDLLEEHIDYFQEAYQSNDKDKVAREVCQFYNSSQKLKNKWIHCETNLNDGQWMDFEPEDYASEKSEESVGLYYDTADSDESVPATLSEDEETPSKKRKTK